MDQNRTCSKCGKDTGSPYAVICPDCRKRALEIREQMLMLAREKIAEAEKEAGRHFTKQQRWAIEHVIADGFLGHSLGAPEEYEWKQVQVGFLSPLLPSARVLVEIGRKNDENTMASIFCRETFQCFIGKKGGMTAHHREFQREKKYSGRAAISLFRAGIY